MKFDNQRAFEKHLQSAAPDHLSLLYMVISKEDYERKNAYERLASKLGPSKSYPAAQVESALEDLNALSLFENKRFIHLSGIESLTLEWHVQLIQAFKRLDKGVHLLLSGKTLTKNTKLYKSAEEHGIIVDIAELKPWEKEKALQQWVVEQFAEQGKQVALQTALSLIKQIGHDQNQLTQEIEKLICFTGERRVVNDADLAAISTFFNLDTIWQLGEALFNRDGKTAFSIFKALLDDGGAPLALLRQIRSQFQTDFQVCCLLQNGESVVEHFPYMKGKILDKHIDQARKYGMNRFKRGLMRIDETELAIKNSSIASEILTDLLIARLIQ